MAIHPARLLHSLRALLPHLFRAALCVSVLWLAGCAGPPKQIFPTGPAPSDPVYVTVSTQTGKASYYFGRWIGRKTASGEIYRASDVTAAHRTLPFNTMVRVTNLRNDQSVIVRINNRGPFVRGRIIDLSLEAARAIDMTRAGVVPVKVEVLRKVEVMPAPNLRRREGPLTPPESAEASPARETGGAAPSSRVSGGRRR